MFVKNTFLFSRRVTSVKRVDSTMNISGAAVRGLSSLGGGGDLFIPASMAVCKDKNDDIDNSYKECDSEDSSVVMSDIDEKEKSEAASILSQMNSDIVKKYENTSIEISDCVFLKDRYSEDLNEAKKGRSTENASVPGVKAGKEKANKSLTAQEVMKYAEKYNDAILLMENAVKRKNKRNGQKSVY